MLRLIALVLPLGLDTFAVSAAIGVAGVDPRQRLRLSLLFASFEGLMPLIGFLVGTGVGGAIGADADYIAGALLVTLGGYMVWPRDESDEVEAASRIARTHGLALIGLGIGISLDELAIGFSAGLLRMPIVLALVLIAGQAFLVTQIGMRAGTRAGEEVREGAERLAGLALILLGLFFIATKVA